VLAAGGSVNVTAEEDLTLTGSQVVAGRDVNLDAIAGDINILPGQESFSASSESSDWGFGISFASTPSSISIGIGINSNAQGSGQSGQSNAQSVISAGRDVNISAGDDATLTAAQVSAARDVSIVAEDNVNLNAATDSNNSAYDQSHTFAGVTLEVSSGLVSAAQSAVNLGEKLQDIGSDGGYSIANAAMAGAKAYDAINGILKGGNIVSASATIGISTSQSLGQGSGTSAVVTEIDAGRALVIEATAGDLTAEGVQIAAGSGTFADASAGDISLSAGGDILLASAANDNVSSNDNSTFSFGIGVATGVGFDSITKPLGFGLTGNISASVGSGQGSGTAQTNAHVTGTGDVTLTSGGDATLSGAVVKGDTIKADVGGDLTITSVADTGNSSNSSIGMGLGFGGGDPFGVGGIDPKLSSLSPSFGTGEGQTNWIPEQSGLLASKTLEATVAGNTALNAGIINSTSGDLSLSTDTLTFQDFSGSKTGNSLNLNLSLDVSGAPGALNNLNGTPEPNKPPSNNTLSGSWSMDNKEQEVKATIGAGTITINDQAAQDALVSSGQTQDLASLNRDEALANVTTRDEHHSLEIYLSSNSIKAAIEAGESIVNILADGYDKIGEKDLADALKKGKIKQSEAIEQLAGCGNSQQSFNWNPISWFIGSAQAASADSCIIKLADGTFFEVKNHGGCLELAWAVIKGLYAADNSAEFEAAFNAGMLQSFEDFGNFITSLDQLKAAGSGMLAMALDIIQNPSSFEEKYDIPFTVALQKSLLNFVQAIADQDFATAGAMAGNITGQIVMGAIPGAVVAGGAKVSKALKVLAAINAKNKLIDEVLALGEKISKEKVLQIQKLSNGKIVWLEEGNASAGRKHILDSHGQDFLNKGISNEEIPDLLMKAIKEGNIVGTNGSANVYQTVFNGVQQNVAIGISNNGFIVRANPVSTWKPL
jgi:filamentous hemagglutinin